MYGKLCIFAFASWAGNEGGVIAGLAICGVVLSTANAAAGTYCLLIEKFLVE